MKGGFFVLLTIIWGVLMPKYPKQNKRPNIWRKTHTPFVNGLTGAHRTLVQIFPIYLPKASERRELPTLNISYGIQPEPAWTSLYLPTNFSNSLPHLTPGVTQQSPLPITVRAFNFIASGIFFPRRFASTCACYYSLLYILHTSKYYTGVLQSNFAQEKISLGGGLDLAKSALVVRLLHEVCHETTGALCSMIYTWRHGRRPKTKTKKR